MSTIGYAALSGLQAANKAMQGVADNFANVETEGYHKIEAIFQELGPFPTVAGVKVDNVRAENQLLDNAMQSAILNKQNADTFDDAVKSVDTLPADTLSSSYTELMKSTQNLLFTPNDTVAQQDFNDKAANFQNTVNAYQDTLSNIKEDLTYKANVYDSQVQMLQSQLQAAMKNGTATEDEVNGLKMQLMRASGTLDAYRKVLSEIVPPVELAFLSATKFVQDSMNTLSGQTIFNGDGTTNTITDFTNFDETKIPEWDSQWYAKEIGRIQTWIGNQGIQADNNAAIADKNFDVVSQQYADQFGVDMVEEQVKMMRYQRMYEANAQVIKTQDEMIGTLLNIFS
jgi:flagellar hook-associated protein FlgK